MRTKLGFTLFLLLVQALLAVSVWGKKPPENFSAIAENEHLQLFMDLATTEIAVVDKSSGVFWYSNPPQRAQQEQVAKGAALKKLHSQLQIVYYTPQVVRKELDNFTDSVELQQFKITYLENGVRVDYVLGKEWNDRDLLPIMSRVDEFEVLLKGLADEEERELLRRNYERVSLRKKREGDPPLELADLDVEELLGGFVFCSKDKELSARESRDLQAAVFDSVVENRKDIDRRSRLRKQHLARLVETLGETDIMLLGRKITKWDLDDMISAVRASGYSPQRLGAEHAATGLDPPVPRLEVFKVPLIYRLEGKNLVVEVPAAEIEFPFNVPDESGTKVTYPLFSIKVLPFFGAAGVEEEGYIFVPDGSGALLDFNNGKTYAVAYSQRVYGNDFSFGRLADEATKSQIFLPVYGLKRGDAAFVVIVEEGASLAKINGDVAGRTNSFNTVGAEFFIMAMGKISMPGQDWRLMNVFQAEPYLGNCRLRIGFLNDSAADYVGMAHYYQAYLVEKYHLQRVQAQEQIPFFLEVIGSVQVRRPVLGVPLQVVQPLTSFAETQKIVAELRNEGVSHIQLRYSGWLQGGLEHSYPYQAKIEKKVGTKKDLDKLSSFLAEIGVRLYPDVALLNAYGDLWYRARRDSARQLDRRLGQIFSEEITEWDYNRGLVESRFVVSPHRLPELTQGFLESYRQFNLSNISLRYMGRQLNSDFGRNYLDRERARRIIEDQLQAFKEQGFQIMLDGGNAYALPYADSVVNVPAASSGYIILDRSVPFYQIALRGYLDLAGEPLNLSPDSRVGLLQALETGLSPYFRVVANDPSVLKGSEFNHLLAVYFEHWKDTALEFYREINEILADVQGLVIRGHEKIEENVFKTSYENGKTILVNYNNAPVIAEGFFVAAKGYKVIREGYEGGGEE